MSKKKLLWITVIAFFALLVFVTLSSLNSGDAELVPVQTELVQRQKLVQTVNAAGRIQPKTQVKISADVSAKIMKLQVKEGDWVEKGDFLLELDRENHLAAVESAEASLRSAQAEVKLSMENMNKAEKDYLRTKELFEKNLESQASLDAFGAAFKVEKARYESSQDMVERAKANLKQVNDDLSKTRIYAPMAGTISQLNKEVGEIALGSQFQEDVILIISNLSGMEAEVKVDENDVVNIALGDSANIEVDAFPDVVFRGVVTEIANSAMVSAEGTAEQKTEFLVKVTVLHALSEKGGAKKQGQDKEIAADDPGARLRPGMTASCDIVTDVRENALSVPLQSVAVRTVEQLNPEKTHGENEAVADENAASDEYTPDKDGFVEVVFVVNGMGTVHANQVKTGIQSETHIEILQGLTDDTEIVIGNYRAISKDLQNGTAVEAEKKSK